MGQSLPSIAGVAITTDAAGRFNLNALHHASGMPASKSPSKWLENETTKALVSALEDQNPNSGSVSEDRPVSVINGGLNPGTFAHELIAVSYAGWISPSFQLQVNRVFVEYRTSRIQGAALAQPRANAEDLPPLADALAIQVERSSMPALQSAQILEAAAMAVFPGAAEFLRQIRSPALPAPAPAPAKALRTAVVVKKRPKARPAPVVIINPPPMGFAGLQFNLSETAQFVAGGQPELSRAMVAYGLLGANHQPTAAGKLLVSHRRAGGHTHWKTEALLHALGKAA